VEQQPVFPGGEKALNDFIRENLKYPAEAKKSGKEGLVVVQFVVDRNGKISDPTVVKSLGAGTDEEALRVVELFPDFQPAKQNGQPVEFRFTLPIRFGLAPKDPANGYIPPSKANPSGSYLSTLNKAPAASADCQPLISFIQNEQSIDLSKTRPAGNLKVAFAIPPTDCPVKNYRIEKIRYYLDRDSDLVGDMTVTVNSFNLNKLLSLSQPGDVLNIMVMGRRIPGKDNQASSPFGVGTAIPLN
jgi:TonB family protein